MIDENPNRCDTTRVIQNDTFVHICFLFVVNNDCSQHNSVPHLLCITQLVCFMASYISVCISVCPIVNKNWTFQEKLSSAIIIKNLMHFIYMPSFVCVESLGFSFVSLSFLFFHSSIARAVGSQCNYSFDTIFICIKPKPYFIYGWWFKREIQFCATLCLNHFLFQAKFSWHRFIAFIEFCV